MLRSTRVRNSTGCQLTFTLGPGALPADVPAGPISVVGDFNAWTPGRHVLHPLQDGRWSVSVRVPAANPIRFRYLAPGGLWFDDPEVPERDGRDCLARV